MAYEKNTWKSGDVITSEKLNHIEEGIEEASGGSELEVIAEIEVGTMDYDSEFGLYSYELSETIELPTDRQLYFNSEDYPLTYEDRGGVWFYNIDYATQTITPPAFMVTSGADQSVGSTENLSNTTVQILAEAVSNNKFIVNLTEDDGTWTANQSVRAILDAHAAGKVCVATTVLDDVQVEIPLSGFVDSDEFYHAVFFDGTATVDYPVHLYAAGFIEDNSDGWSCVIERLVTDTNLMKVVYHVLDDGQGGYTVSSIEDGINYSDIYDAMDEEKQVVAIATGDIMATLPNAAYISDGSGFIVFGATIDMGSGGSIKASIIHFPDETINVNVVAT